MSEFDILVPIIAILVGGTVVIIPLLGLTARFALKPLVESWSRFREAPIADERERVLDRRISLLEDQVQILEKQNAELIEAREFSMRLETGS
ncbi:MAG: hypothetical protein WD766_03865 [Gemmatimonadota bacterium]